MGDKPTAEQLYELSTEAFQAGDIELALERAEVLIRQAPEDFRDYYLRGTILAQDRKDYAQAVADLAEVNRLVPDFTDAWGSRGWYLILLGRFEEARPPTEKAQALDPESMNWTINLGHTYLLLGERESARAWYRKSIPLIPDEVALQAGPLADFDLFIARGWAPETAHEERAWIEQAWTEWQAIAALNAQVLERYRAGDYQGAIPLAEEGLERAKRIVGDAHPAVATRLDNLAVLLQTTGRYTEAEPLYREALAIRRATLPEDHPDIATSLGNLAGLLKATGRYAEAEPLYREALAIADQAGEPEILWHVQGNLGGLHAKQDQRPLAIFFGKQAVNTLQSVRQNLAAAEQATQQAFLKSKEAYYKDLAELLTAEGRLPEAQQVLRMLKEQELFELIRRDAAAEAPQSRIGNTHFEAKQEAHLAGPRRTLAEVGAELRRLQALKVPTPEEQARMAKLEAQLRQAVHAFQAAVEEIETAFKGQRDALTWERSRMLDKRIAQAGNEWVDLLTLWPVADASTGAFMQTLYRLRTEQHLTKAEALRQAQLAMLRGAIRPRAAAEHDRQAVLLSKAAPSKPAAEPPGDYRHPYYWAPSS